MNDHSYNIHEQTFICLEVLMKLPSNEIIDKMESILNIASDSTRIKILYSLLSEKEKTVGQIIKEVEASQSLISHQLKVLRDARLVTTRKEGKNVYYSLNDDHVEMLLKVVFEHVMEEEHE